MMDELLIFLVLWEDKVTTYQIRKKLVTDKITKAS
jgi:hypothetical protein